MFMIYEQLGLLKNMSIVYDFAKLNWFKKNEII